MQGLHPRHNSAYLSSFTALEGTYQATHWFIIPEITLRDKSSHGLYLCRSRRKRAEEDLEDEYEDRSKSPMYDELSLPFIDASLPPTPKVGRIVNGLDILLGHGVSENSLVGKSWRFVL